MKDWFGKYILGLPPLASENGQDVDDLIIYVHWLMIALFIGWIIYFFYALCRFQQLAQSRRPIMSASATMPQAISNWPWPAWKPCCWFSSPCRCGPRPWINFPPASESTVIQVVAQQYAWNARYAGPGRHFRPAGHEVRRLRQRLRRGSRPTPTARTTSRCSTKSMSS